MQSTPLSAADLRQKLNLLSTAEQDVVIEQLRQKTYDGSMMEFGRPALEMAKALLPLATAYSIAPISGFQVGAIAIGASGQLYLGANMEFVGVPLSASLHAEQSAVLNAWMHGESRIEALVISEAPCGHCRQFLWELSKAAQLKIVVGEQTTNLPELFPLPFGKPRQTGEGLLDSPPIALQPLRPITGDAAQRALEAAQQSYAPYTQTPAGVFIECTNGSSFAGRTAESIAFNPTVPALTCALNQRNLSHSRNEPIGTCTHAKLATSPSSQSEFSESVLSRLTHVAITTVLMEPRYS
jgi:cytidine deaminase